MTQLEHVPLPLTPDDCDLRDFAFMPLDVARLRDSDLAIQVGAEEFRAAVLLWCAAWHQVPAASLPDDDKALAALAGYGRVVAEWRKHREGALYGWVKCDDGRLYHPVVAEKARDAWQAKHKHAHDKLLDRVRKANKQREQLQLPPWIVPSLEDWIAAGFPLESELFPAESTDDSGGKIQKRQKRSDGNQPEKPLKGEGQGQYLKEKETAAASLAHTTVREGDPAPPTLDQGKTPQELAMAVAVWMRRKEQARGKQPRGTNGSDPRIAAWVQAGATALQLAEAYDLAVLDRQATGDAGPITPGFLDVFVAKVLKPPKGESALNGKPRQTAATDPLAWATTASGITTKGDELGIVQGDGEIFPAFKARVHAAAGLTEADRARLLADYGVRV